MIAIAISLHSRMISLLTGIDLHACPVCHKGQMRPVQRIPADPFPLHPVELLDTSSSW